MFVSRLYTLPLFGGKNTNYFLHGAEKSDFLLFWGDHDILI